MISFHMAGMFELPSRLTDHRGERGAMAAEYAFLAALVFAAGIVAFSVFGSSLMSLYESSAGDYSEAIAVITDNDGAVRGIPEG